MAELSKLGVEDRREVLDRIYEIEEHNLPDGGATTEEKALLERESEEYREDPEAGSSQNEVEAHIRKSTPP